MNVDFPQPDGPINAMTQFCGNAQRSVLDSLKRSVVNVEAFGLEFRFRRRVGEGGWGGKHSRHWFIGSGEKARLRPGLHFY